MFEIQFIEVFVRILPESLLFIWACYALSQTKIKLNRYFLSVIFDTIITYGINFLPIHPGVNFLLQIGTLIIALVIINKINIIKSIQVSICVYIIEFICEFINLLLVKYLFKADIDYIFSNFKLKMLYALPSLLLFVCSIILLNFIINKKTPLHKKSELTVTEIVE
ncbi:hypothetical protein DIC82_18895 [Clostridium beijerinckii]|nr:hypothetical protein DIC82_18895 [Clostridium beijerinckii]